MDANLATASRLASWFAQVLDVLARTIGATSADERHRTAAIQSVLTRNARIAVASRPNLGAVLIRPTVLVLASASQLLRLRPGEREWLGALNNVASLETEMKALFEQHPNAEPLLGGPVGVFKAQFDEALVQAGVTNQPTILARDNRQLALGLAVNWGMRFLVAHGQGLLPDDEQDRLTRELRELVPRAA